MSLWALILEQFPGDCFLLAEHGDAHAGLGIRSHKPPPCGLVSDIRGGVALGKHGCLARALGALGTGPNNYPCMAF